MCKIWSSNFACLQGKAERDACYKPIIEEIQRLFPRTEWLGNYTFLYVVSNLKVSISLKETFLFCLYEQIIIQVIIKFGKYEIYPEEEKFQCVF